MSKLSDHWEQYLKGIGATIKPTSTSSVSTENTSTKIGVSGFLDLKPANLQIQARYDAMSGSWEGVEATNKAIFTHDMFKNNVVTFTQNNTQKK